MSVAKYTSVIALVVATIFMIGAVQSSGSILDTCLQGGMSINKISYEKCREIGTSISKKGDTEAAYLSLLLVIARVEATLFLGLGAGAIYALAFLEKGTEQVAVVHLMHAIWAISVCLVHAHSAGYLGDQGVDPNVDQGFYKTMPIVPITGIQAILFSAAFFLSSGNPSSDKLKRQ